VLWVPQKGPILVQHNLGSVGDTTPGGTATTGAAASTKGPVVEVFAATLFDAYWIDIYAWGYGLSATASMGCMDILTGAATEEVLIPDLLFGSAAGQGYFAAAAPTCKKWAFPLYIPAGSRISVRVAGQRVSTAMRFGIVLRGGNGVPPFRCGSKVTTYGVTVPSGTTIVPGASAAEGAWTQIVASTTEDHFAFFPSFQPGSDTTLTLLSYSLDMGIGAATEEEMLGGAGYMYDITGGELMAGPYGYDWPAFQDVPSGTRLVARVSNSGVNDGAYQAAIHAVG
jgi:hypothetical protein